MATYINLRTNDITIPALMNDTVAAVDFRKRLPIQISGYRSEMDYCCQVTCGVFNPLELQQGWKNGDISLAGGWFAVFFGGEKESKQYKNIMVIAHIDEKYQHLLNKLPNAVKFTIEIAN